MQEEYQRMAWTFVSFCLFYDAEYFRKITDPLGLK